MMVLLYPSPPRSAPPPDPSNFSLFLSLYKTNRQVKKKKNKSKRSEKAEQRKPTIRNHSTQKNTNEIKSLLQNKIRQKKSLQNHRWGPFCVGHILWAWDHPWCMIKTISVLSLVKTFFSLFKHLSIGDCCLSRMGYCFSSGPLYDLDMYIRRLCLEQTVSKVPSNPSDSCSLSTSSSAWWLYSKGRCLMETSYLLLGIPCLYTLYCCRSVCMNSNHL